MPGLWLYQRLDRLQFVNYRGKIMVTAFLGTHVPLLAIVVLMLLLTAPDLNTTVWVLGVALVATLIGTAVTLYVLNELLKPIRATAKSLRDYVGRRVMPQLPTNFRDEVGVLMADAGFTVERLDETIRQLEFSDPETGLPNRAALEQSLAKKIGAATESKPVAIIALHIGNLRGILAASGGDAGIEVLRTLVMRLHRYPLNEGLVARVDSDALALLVPDAADVESLEGTVRRVLADLREPLNVGAQPIAPVVTAGIALAPADGNDPRDLVARAMAAATNPGEDTRTRGFHFHSVSAANDLLGRWRIEADLRVAIERGDFELHYQPVVARSSGETVGAEALIRWRHPEQGLILPAHFIPIAEESGLIDGLGRWVMTDACNQARSWRAAGLQAPRISVNLSARQFQDKTVDAWIAGTLKQAGLEPSALEVEITESAAMRDLDYAVETLGRLRAMGVLVALDDFGTGYSSLTYLKALPIDVLKIDQAFVRNISGNGANAAICSAVIALANGLGLQVIAEGVEDEHELAWLADKGCDLFQGFYFARPMPAEAFSQRLLTRAA